MPSMPRPSICACRCSRGRRFAPPRRLSSCTRCSICGDRSPPSSTSPTARCTTSMYWTCFLSRPAPSTSWIGVTWTSSGSTRSIRREASSSRAPSKTSMHGACIRRRWIATRDLICDQTIALNGFYAAKHYPGHLRRIRYRDPETSKNLVFLTNQFALPAPTICALYRCRWQVELFFKWIKQHLRIKRFYGTSENAVRTQIWIAISVYVLVAIIKKQLRLDVSLHALLQILSLTLFEKVPLQQAITGVEPIANDSTSHNQLKLFEF